MEKTDFSRSMYLKKKQFFTSFTYIYQHITRRQILASSKLKEFEDDNSNLTKITKLSKRVENTVGQGEIARYK